MTSTRRMLQFGAIAVIFMTAQALGSDIEYIQQPDYGDFKQQECVEDCILVGILGSRFVEFSRDEDGTPSLRLQSANTLEHTLRPVDSGYSDLLPQAPSFSIERWDEEFLKHLDTGLCEQDCHVQIQFQNEIALIARTSTGRSLLAWPTKVERTAVYPSSPLYGSEPGSSPISLTGSGYGDCAGNPGSGPGAPTRDPSKTQIHVLSCYCLDMVDRTTGTKSKFVRRTVEYWYFDCEGNLMEIETRVYELYLMDDEPCLSGCTDLSAP